MTKPVRFAGLLALLAFLQLSVAHEALASSVPIPPAPAHWVTDEAGFLSDATRTELDRKLEAFERGTGHQILLWIGRTSGDTPIEDWSARAFAAWRVGRKGIDDGLVIFILFDDRKVRIEVGYGLEGQLPDVRASRVIREAIVPRLRVGDRDGAARAGVEAVVAALGGAAFPATGSSEDQQNPLAKLGWPERIVLGLLFLLAIGFLITHPDLALALLVTMASGGGHRRGRGFPGGGGGFSGGGGRSGGGGATGSW